MRPIGFRDAQDGPQKGLFSFCLLVIIRNLQAQFDKASNGGSSGRQVLLLASPIVDCLQELCIDAHLQSFSFWGHGS
jgi:hypothetical protein